MRDLRYTLLYAIFSLINLAVILCVILLIDLSGWKLATAFVAFGVFSALLEHQIEKRLNRVVSTPPGNHALRSLTFLLPKKPFEAIFAQAIADMREEHAEALASRQVWKARWIVWRDHGNLILTLGLFLVTTLGKKIKAIWTAV